MLPVELIEFKGKKKEEQVLLQWQTAWEKNNSHFVVERSTDGSDFETLGLVPSIGEGPLTRTYEFRDQRPQAGRYVYR